MRFTYKVRLTPEVDGGYTVECDDLPGLVSCGITFVEAVNMAADALATYVASLLQDDRPIPDATDYEVSEGSMGVWVSVESSADDVMGPCVSAAEAARMLGVTPGRVSQLVSSGALRANRKAGHVYVEIASVEARRAKAPVAGRPSKGLLVR